MKKVLSFLFEYDFIWSLPVVVLGFVLFPILGTAIFGDGFGFYSPELLHSVIASGLILMSGVSFIQMGMYFQVPEVYKFYLGEG